MIISKQDSFYSNYEIIICDSKSQDDSEKKAKNLIKNNLRYYHCKINSPAAKRNMGIKKSRGEWIIFFDDDNLPSKNFCRDFKSAITKKQYSNSLRKVFYSKIYYPAGLLKNNNHTKYLQSRYYYNNSRAINYKNMQVSNICLNRRSILKDKILFDVEYIFHFEDFDFSYKLFNKGYNFIYINSPAKHIKKDYSIDTFLANRFEAHRAFLMLLRKSPVLASKTNFYKIYCPATFFGRCRFYFLRIIINRPLAIFFYKFISIFKRKSFFYFPFLYKYISLS